MLKEEINERKQKVFGLQAAEAVVVMGARVDHRPARVEEALNEY